MVAVLCCVGICLFGRACSFAFDNVMLFSLGEYLRCYVGNSVGSKL